MNELARGRIRSLGHPIFTDQTWNAAKVLRVARDQRGSQRSRDRADPEIRVGDEFAFGLKRRLERSEKLRAG